MDKKANDAQFVSVVAETTGDDFDVMPVPDPPKNKFDAIYRSALFQICVVSALAFCGPAMADAISGLGGGGQASPYFVSESHPGAVQNR